MRDKKRIRMILIAVIAVALALSVYLLFFKGIGGFFEPITKSPVPAGDSSSEDSDDRTEGTDVTVTEGIEDADDETGDEAYYAANYSDFFTFNGHSAEYSFQNDKVVKADVDAGGQISVGAVGGSVQGEQTGIIINAQYTGGNDNHSYGIQIFDGYDIGFFALSGSNGITRMSDFDEWEMSVSMNGNGTVSANNAGTRLYWRTWDQQYTQEYQDSTKFGLIWTYDEPTAYSFDVELLLRLYDYTESTELGVFKITIGYDESAGVYSLSSIESAPFLEYENDGSLVQAAEEKLKSYALEMFRSGVFYTSFGDAGEEDDDLTTDDVRVFDVPEIFWCEIVNTDGEIYARGEEPVTGALMAAVLERTDTSHGPITMYYGISYETDEDGKKTPLCSLVGYDWISEKKWDTLMIRNGFTISESRMAESRTDDLYYPKWKNEAEEGAAEEEGDSATTTDIPEL